MRTAVAATAECFVLVVVLFVSALLAVAAAFTPFELA
jgi:hypothetical protein